jgi:hypothetical protein
LGDFTIVVVAAMIVAAIWLLAKIAHIGDFGDETR